MGGAIGAPAAIANAIANALVPLGIEVAELPVTPDRLFRLIEQARAGAGRPSATPLQGLERFPQGPKTCR